MADSRHITRRQALVGLAVSAATVGSAAAIEAVSASPPTFDLAAWLETQTPAQRVNYHQTKLAEAMCELNPGKWRTAFTPQNDALMVIRDPLAGGEKPSIFVKYFY